MADGIYPSLISKDRDANAVDNAIFVQLSSGSTALGVTGTSLNVNISNATVAVTQSGTWNIGTVTTLTGITNDVNIADGGNSITVDDGGASLTIDGSVTLLANSGVDIGDVDVTSVVPGVGATNLGKAEDAVHATGDVGVMALAVRQDTQVDLGADGDYVPFSIDADGKLRVTTEAQSTAEVKVDDSAFAVGTDSVAVTGYLADETAPDSVDEGDVGVARMTLDRKQLMVMVDATNDAQRLAIDTNGEIGVNVSGFTAGTRIQVSKDDNQNSELNPIFVQPVSTVTSGEEIHDFDHGVDVASDTGDNHDYTVAGTTFLLKSVIVSGSGNVKAEIQVGPLASLATKAVIFLTGRQGDTEQVDFNPPIEIPSTSTGTVRVIRTNRQGASVDVYSTIIGNDI